MPILFKAVFNTVNGDANFGKILLYADSDNNPSGTTIEFKIVDPSGVTIRDFPGTPDYTVPLTPPGGFVLAVTEDIPENAGDFIRGTYVLYGKTQLSPAAAVTYSESFFFDPANDPDGNTVKGANGNYIGVLTPSVDCRTAEVTFTDDTDHDGWTIDDRLLTVQPPIVPGDPNPSPVTTTDESLTEAFNYTNVIYQGTLVVERSKDTVGDEWTFEQLETVEASASTEIDCGRGICDILPCLDSRFQSLYNKACSYGGWAKVPVQEMATMQALMFMSQLYYFHSECGDYEKAAQYKGYIDQITGGACTCGCSGDTQNSIPLPYTPNSPSSTVIIE